MIFQSCARTSPDIAFDTDGFFRNLFRGEGFVQVDAGVTGVGPAVGHVPEGIFDDARGVVAGAKFQKEDFGGLVALEKFRVAFGGLVPASSSTKVLSARRFMVRGLPQ